MIRIMTVTVVALMMMGIVYRASSLRFQAEIAKYEEQAMDTIRLTHGNLQDRFGTNWNEVQTVMDGKHGLEWTNQLTPEQWITLHELGEHLSGK